MARLALPSRIRLFDMQVPAGTDSDPIVFDALGTYDVTCRIHTTMHLVITVE